MNKKQLERLDNINKLVELIANTDRCFFKYNNEIGHFVPLKTTVKWYEERKQKTITVTRDNEMYFFTHGGTLKSLICDFKEYILTGKTDGCDALYGGLYATCWGYTKEGMEEIRKYGRSIGYLEDEKSKMKNMTI